MLFNKEKTELKALPNKDIMNRTDSRNKDYTCFSKEQMIFKDDTMYMLVY